MKDPIYLLTALRAAYEAGKAVLNIYNLNLDFGVEAKADQSPITRADKKAHDIISLVLKNQFIDKDSSLLTPHISLFPILSEEGLGIPYDERKNWEYFWLVDPLDGTREFIKKNGEFTVNIALIHEQRPVLGVVYVPVTGVMYYAAEGLGAFKLVKGERVRSEGKDEEVKSDRLLLETLNNTNMTEILSNSIKLPLNGNNISAHSSRITIIASRSHMNRETEEFIGSLKKKYEDVTLISAGSSLKFCHVAEGRAHMYPRLGPTMEWDTAAGHAIVKYAGKTVKVFDTDVELLYNKENLLNPPFLVC
jgi:3'(2'), 5'-bisphosphate nucleotidase